MTEPFSLSKLRPKKRFWFTAFVLAAALMLWTGYLQYQSERRFLSQEWAQNLASVGSLKANQIGEWRRERLADCERYAQGIAHVTAALDFIRHPDGPNNREAFLHLLTLNRKGNFYDNAIATTKSGDCLLAAVPLTEPLCETTLHAVHAAVETQKPEFSAIYRERSGKAVVDIAAPVFDNVSASPVCILILRCEASTFLYPLLHFWSMDSPSAETLLVRQEGKDVLFLNAVRHGGRAALDLTLPLSRTDLPAARAVQGAKGFFEGRDYRNVEVFADLRPIPGSDWFLVTKIDRREVYHELLQRGLGIARIVALSILLMGALISIAYRRRQNALYKNLYRAEKEQREAHERFEAILYSIGDAVIVTDNHARVQQMNPVAENLTGWPEREAVGKPLDQVFTIFTERDRKPVESPVLRILREGKVVGLANHTVLISRNGIERPVADSGAPVRDENGTVDGVVLVFRDQSAERTAQNALVESERRLATLLDNLPGVAYRCDMDEHWTMRFMSKGALELLGYVSEDLIGNARVPYIDLIHPHDRDMVRNAIQQAVATQRTYTLEYRVTTKAGYEKWVWERGCAVPASNGKVNVLEGFITDITDSKESRKHQATLELQLQQSQRIEALGRLAGGVAHDFNNMLSVIVGNAELAQERLAASQSAAHELSEIVGAGKRSADLVRQLLAFARKQMVRPCVLNLNETITGMMSMLKRLIDEDIVLDWRPGPLLWSIKIDTSQIDQLFVNLIVNAKDAIKSTDKATGTIVIETSNVSITATLLPENVGTPTGDFVLVSVTDSGCGMDAETQAHIFEPFFTTKRKEVGTGLGLSTVYGIVKQNGGFVRVASVPGQGSRFDIHLPRHNFEAAHEPSPLLGAASRLSVGTGTILLVEDEPALLSLSVALIKKLGYTVLAAPSPEEAIHLASSHSGDIHVLMTDVVMPGMSGFDLWKQLARERPLLKGLYMSGYTSDIIARHGVQEDDIVFLAKPFSKDALARKLRDLFSTIQNDDQKPREATT